MVEVSGDGTALVRARIDGMPVATLTSSATNRIAQASGQLVDQLAREAAKSPAPWAFEG